MEDLAAYWVRRLRALYPLSERPTASELYNVCVERGCEVALANRLIERGYFVHCVRPFILLRHPMSAKVLAHELWHFLSADEGERGMVVCYRPGEPRTEEEGAVRFTRLLYGEAA